MGWGPEHRCSTDSPSTLPCSSSTPPAGQHAPCIAVPAAARTPPERVLSQTTAGTLWGCVERCGSRYDRGLSSMSVALLFRFAGTACQQFVNVVSLRNHQPDSRNRRRSSRPRKPRRRPSVSYWRALCEAQPAVGRADYGIRPWVIEECRSAMPNVCGSVWCRIVAPGYATKGRACCDVATPTTRLGITRRKWLTRLHATISRSKRSHMLNTNS